MADQLDNIKAAKRSRFLSRLASSSPWLLVILSFAGGVVAWGGFNWSLELTNTESFCISCHEMRENVYKEYRNTIHYTNPTGVRATCPDCHVPREWVHKVIRKVAATNELFHHFAGSIDSREKFISKRFELAQHVWQAMEQTDSRECRNCHDMDSMDLPAQTSPAAQTHRAARQQGKTCIDCHKGIAHELPEEYLEQEHERFKEQGVVCAQCHVGMARPPAGEEW